MDKLIKVGKYNTKYNTLLGYNLNELDIYRSKGLPSHMVSRKHYDALKYIDNIPDIINNPDYIGINPREKDISFELIKIYNDHILLGIKLDTSNNYLYVSTMHVIQEGKLLNRLNSGRIKPL